MKSQISKKQFLLMVLILIVASFLRLYRIADYMTFLGDEGRDVLKVYDILHGKPTLLGPTASVGGFFLGPVYYYFITPFLFLFNYNPVGPAVMVALFGIATVFLIYKIGSEFFNNKVGLIAAFLYSLSPLVIAYSRSSWNPNLMPFFSLLTLYIFYKALQKQKTILFLFGGLLLGIAMQLHYLSIFLGMIIGFYILTIRVYEKKDIIKKLIKDYFLAGFGFVVGLLPFLAFEARHGFPNIQSIVSFVFKSEDVGNSSHFFATLGNVFFRLFGRLVTNFPPPEQVALGAHTDMAIWYYATFILGLVSLLLLFFKFIKSLRTPLDFKRISLLTLWFVLGVGLFGFYKKPIYDYYFGFMFPLPFLLVGNFISSLYTDLHRLVRRLATLSAKFINSEQHGFTQVEAIGKFLAIAVLLSLTLINLRGVPFRFEPNRQLAQVREISNFVLAKTDSKPFNFALITGGNSDHGYRYFFTLSEKKPVAIENEKIDPLRKTVTEQLLVVCEIECHPLGDPLWEVAGFGRAEIVDSWDVSVVKVYKLEHWRGK